MHSIQNAGHAKFSCANRYKNKKRQPEFMMTEITDFQGSFAADVGGAVDGVKLTEGPTRSWRPLRRLLAANYNRCDPFENGIIDAAV